MVILCTKLNFFLSLLGPQELTVEKGNLSIPDLQPVSNPNVEQTSGHGSSSGIEILPIQWNLTMVLSKSQPVELLFPMFIQNLNNSKDEKECDKGQTCANSSAFDKPSQELSKIEYQTGASQPL